MYREICVLCNNESIILNIVIVGSMLAMLVINHVRRYVYVQCSNVAHMIDSTFGTVDIMCNVHCAALNGFNEEQETQTQESQLMEHCITTG